MKRWIACLCFFLLPFILPTSQAQILVDHTCVDADKIPQPYLDLARQHDIFFCHASVGMSIMSGMSQMENADPFRYAMEDVANAPATWFDTHDGILHLDYGGGWMNPSKIEGFENKVRNEGYHQADIAFMKFCYIDWGALVDPYQQWYDYRDMMEGLEASYPDTTFVWWTSALNNNGEYGGKRSIFDNLLRDYCAQHGKVVFDLAAIESHDPDGNMALDDNGFEGMYAGYATDGQHPSGDARIRLAGALWWLFARIAGWEVAPTRLDLASNTDVLGTGESGTAVLTVRLYDENNDLYIETEEAEVTFQLDGPGRLEGPATVMTERGKATIAYKAAPQHPGTGGGLQPATLPGAASIQAISPGLMKDEVILHLIHNRMPDPPQDLECNGLKDPMNLPTGYPDLTWTFSDPNIAKGDVSSAYRLLVADNPWDIEHDIGNVWDTGKVTSNASWANPCPAGLQVASTFYWKVMNWDVSDVPGPYSLVAFFSLADGLGYGIRMDPEAGSVNFGQQSCLDLQTGNGITIEMWIYRTEENRDSVILDKFIPFAGGWRIGVDAADHVYFRTRKQMGGDRRVTAFDAKVSAGSWHHIACCQTGSAGGDDGVVYIDGVRSGFNGLINLPWPVAKDLCLAQSGAVVDELRISSTLRYTSDFPPPSSPFAVDGHTIGLWHFDEGQGALALDESPNHNHGTIFPDHGWGADYFIR